MNAGMVAMLQENLRFLKLSAMAKNFENVHRQALENKLSYDEFLLNLTEIKSSGSQRQWTQKKNQGGGLPFT